jgi:enoyl-CoA hydratase
MHFEMIKVQTEEGLATITIDRPEVLNAMSPELLTELTMAVAELELDDEAGVVILTGVGKAFVAGADISVMAEMGPRDAQLFAELGANLGQSIEESSKPYIAAVNGFALGGGCELALACDFIYASTKAKLGQPEVVLGVIPGFGGTQRLSRRVGVSKAKELIFTGEVIRADEAYRIGLVDSLSEPDELLDKARATGQAILKNGPLAVAEAKRVIHVGLSMTLEQGNQLEQLAFASLFDTDDQREGMAAFLAKRPPEFKGQ